MPFKFNPITGTLDLVNPTSAGGAASQKYNETPAGLIDGSNVAFTTASSYATTTIRIYLNGQRLAPTNDYTETGVNTFSLVAPPVIGDTLIVDYIIV